MTDADNDPRRVIFAEFAKGAAEGWVRGEVRYRQTGKTSQSTAEAFSADGKNSYPRIRGFAFGRAVRALRAQMAQPGTGAWFSAIITLTSDGRFSMDADYDNEPDWNPPIVAETYVEEQELFPRDEENQPEWYKQKLREARRG